MFSFSYFLKENKKNKDNNTTEPKPKKPKKPKKTGSGNVSDDKGKLFEILHGAHLKSLFAKGS